jgi:hypothetical protein
MDTPSLTVRDYCIYNDAVSWTPLPHCSGEVSNLVLLALSGSLSGTIPAELYVWNTSGLYGLVIVADNHDMFQFIFSS